MRKNLREVTRTAESCKRNTTVAFFIIRATPFQKVMPNSSELHEQCTEALKVFITEAQKTCDLLEKHQHGRLDAKERQAMLAQRQKENEAHEHYQHARKALIDATLGGG
jgi:hypothetical protein